MGLSRKDKKNNHKIGRWLIFFSLFAWLYKILRHFFSPSANHKSLKLNFLDFTQKEKKEFKRWRSGREDFKHYCLHSRSLFEDYFIPHLGNNYQPKILRARSLLAIVLVLVLLKAAVVGYLFLTYPNQARMSADMAEQTLELINQARAQNNLPPLKFNPVLSAAAMAKARDMVAEDYFAHRSPGGLWPWDWINRSQYPYIYVGENLAMNFSSAQAAHNALMQSPSHKKNILNKNYKEIGIAVVNGKIDGRQTDVLVELFAARAEPLKLAVANKTETAAAVQPANQPAQAAEGDTSQPKPSQPASQPVAKHKAPEVAAGSKVKPAAASQPAPQPAQPAQPPTATATAAHLPLTQLLGTKVAPPRPRFSQPAPEANPLNSEVKYFKEQNSPGWSIVEQAIKFLYWLFWLAMLFLVFALLANIFIRLNVQHKGVIVQALLAIIFISALLLIRLHPVEYLLSYVIVV